MSFPLIWESALTYTFISYVSGPRNSLEAPLIWVHDSTDDDTLDSNSMQMQIVFIMQKWPQHAGSNIHLNVNYSKSLQVTFYVGLGEFSKRVRLSLIWLVVGKAVTLVQFWLVAMFVSFSIFGEALKNFGSQLSSGLVISSSQVSNSWLSSSLIFLSQRRHWLTGSLSVAPFEVPSPLPGELNFFIR